MNGNQPAVRLESCVTDDKIYCVHIAPDEATVREHARRGGFPATQASEVRVIIDPTTADSPGGVLENVVRTVTKNGRSL